MVRRFVKIIPMSESTSAPTPAHRYTAEMAARIEHDWQQRWNEPGTFHADNPEGELAGPKADRDPYFLLDMFPYPSGKGLHVGHPLGFIATDVLARYQRMQGKNVLYTLGYDAFGLPAEQFAIQTGQHPRITSNNSIDNMRGQLSRIGFSYDKRRELATTDDDYVRWTQWIFLQIFNSWYDPNHLRRDGGTGSARPISELIAELEDGTRPTPDGRPFAEYSAQERADLVDSHRLAYIAHAPVNWCPGLGTVLANEEVTAEGRSERGNYPVFPSRLRQWMMRITAYADRLAEDLDTIDWPESIRAMQRNWIGRSDGATVTFDVETADGAHHDLEVYTTRPDTLFGATFMVISPEHPLLSDPAALPSQWPEGTRAAWHLGAGDPASAVAQYRAQAAARSDAERQDDDREKTGVFTGLYGANPVNGAAVPIFAADYVLMGYGTGAIMAVPAHDERDHAFATRFELPIIATMESPHDVQEEAYTGDGVVINSANDQVNLNGLDKDAAKAAMTAWLEESGLGYATTTYRLRDWLFSRQRYWGEPFPVVYDADGMVHALPETMLPVTLPPMDDFSPRTFDPDDADSTPEAPLGRAQEWVAVELDLGDGPQTYYRDTNTMPNWAGSCWYEMRYCDPTNEERPIGKANEAYWMGPRTPGGSGGADLYVGGVEHAVLHLLYARFWHKVLYDLGHISSFEPFHRLFNQGYIQAYAYTDARGQYVPAEEVEGDEQSGFTWQGQPVNREYGKMGKSLKNIVTPEAMCDAYGADTFRLFEMSMGPLDVSRPWETRAIVGSHRFLQRLWRNIVDEDTGEVTVTQEVPDEQTARLLARTIADVREEYDHIRLNTAVARMIVLNNHLTGLPAVPQQVAEALILMVSPLAPHIAEELWARLGHTESLAYEPFPVADESKLVEETVTCVVQVAGKVRDRLEVAPSIDDDALTALALESAGAQKFLRGREPMKVIVRAPRLVNIVPPRD